MKSMRLRQVRALRLSGVSLAVGLMALGLVAPARAASTLDQSQEWGDESSRLCAPTDWAGQTFTAGLTGALDQVDIYLQSPGGRPLTLEIRPVTGGAVPGSQVLAAAQATPAPGEGWVTFSVDPGVPLTAGSLYAIVINDPAAQECHLGNYSWDRGSRDQYQRGTWVESDNGGETWTSVGAADATFRTFVFYDSDSDGIEDSSDTCKPGTTTSQNDMDDDGFGDECDSDVDADGLWNLIDNCPVDANPLQADGDGDRVGDRCDPQTNDHDADGTSDRYDNCPFTYNLEQGDADGDGQGNLCDLSHDIDRDGVLDTFDSGSSPDNCPYVPNPGQGDLDQDGLGDVCDPDADNDTVGNLSDNCATVSNTNQADEDDDGLGDVCDATNDDDLDGDARANGADNCPFTSNAQQTDGDQDGVGDACDATNGLDIDNDSVANADDNCPLEANSDQADGDRDGLGDVCDVPKRK